MMTPSITELWSASPDNPRNWSKRNKWLATMTSCYMSSLVSIAASAYSQAVDGIATDLRCAHLLSVSGISFFTIAVAVFPLFLAPLGENYGRQVVYLTSYAIFFLFFLPTALAHNIATVLISRFLCGAAGSVGSTMVGGTLSDLWTQEDREIPMALFALSALLGTPIGLISFTWAGGPTISWRWIFWTMLAAALPSAIIIALFFRYETLPKQSRFILRKAGYQQTEETERTSRWLTLKQVLFKSAFRPLYFLATEPITLALSTWIAFAWGVLYLFLESIPLVFAQYGFDHANKSRGLAFCGSAVGSTLGFIVHVIYVKRFRSTPTTPEDRLPEACAGAVLFSSGFFIFAWTAKASAIHWIVPQIGTAIIMFGMFLVYICIFDYLADCYGSYSSSAIAAQSFLRNILATAFPLIAERMYDRLTYPWASSLLGFLALFLAAVPFLLFWQGHRLRAKSAFATSHRATSPADVSAEHHG